MLSQSAGIDRSAAFRRCAFNFEKACSIGLSLKLLAIAPPKSHFSCFGNHPDLESRLTLHEKRVLAERTQEICVCLGVALLLRFTSQSHCNSARITNSHGVNL
jgi:hypothetical protein